MVSLIKFQFVVIHCKVQLQFLFHFGAKEHTSSQVEVKQDLLFSLTCQILKLERFSASAHKLVSEGD